MANDLLDLIDADPAVVHGQARFRGTRVPVSVVLDCLAIGMTVEEIHAQYPSLPAEAVRAAIAYGALPAREELHPLEPMPR
ncbi:MAG: DUF433 domain-containing protein [Actinomycetota bacterium]|nr:DUF433 domain-containing protein [Actinomycetota bacterium]